MWHDFRQRKDPPLPPVPCQFCDKSGHQEAVLWIPLTKNRNILDPGPELGPTTARLVLQQVGRNRLSKSCGLE
jgi:hypothetical protein